MNKVLILVDLQNDFITGSLGSVEAQSIIPNIITLIDSWEGKIFLTKDTHDEKYLPTLEGRYLPVEHCIAGTSGFEIDSRINEALKGREVTTVYKHTFGSMGLTSMLNVGDEIYICGLCTDICVISNALLLRAKYPENKIICIANCCAGSSIENHNAALKVMESCQIELI